MKTIPKRKAGTENTAEMMVRRLYSLKESKSALTTLNKMHKNDIRYLTLALKGSGIGLSGVHLSRVSYIRGG